MKALTTKTIDSKITLNMIEIFTVQQRRFEVLTTVDVNEIVNLNKFERSETAYIRENNKKGELSSQY